MNPLIKWPGGKSGEINRIEQVIPPFDRYIEPFFGGGALFFHLEPKKALINDISDALMEFYQLVKEQDPHLLNLLLEYEMSFSNLKKVCSEHYPKIHCIFTDLLVSGQDKSRIHTRLKRWIDQIADEIRSGFCGKLKVNWKDFFDQLIYCAAHKMIRTVPLFKKKPFAKEDLKDNLITGFTAGYYIFFRRVYNDIHLRRTPCPSPQYRAANFYFIREYCYGSMFRYNLKGEFNIPYGGMTYNKKNFLAKIENIFNEEVELLMRDTEIYCMDFEEFLERAKPTGEDFVFLDPPYDTDFSEYEGRAFTLKDHERLAACLHNILAPFILVIKNTDFIYGLYKDHFNVMIFDNQYTYNVRSRNDRDVEHLVVTNLPNLEG